MNSKKINKILNKFIVVLIVFIIGAITQKNIFEKKELQEPSLNIKDSILEVYFFDVGQADSIFLKENDYSVLIDGGNKNDGQKIIKFLKEELNITDLDIIIGTHPHEDHIGGLPQIISSFDIEKIYLPNATTNTKIFENLLDSIEKNNLKITIPKIDETIKLNNMSFKILYTGTDESDLNNTSIVTKLQYGDTSFLFTGDATEKTEEKIINKNISSNVLKIGHHGSKYSTTDNFLDKVKPTYAIIQVGIDNSYGHPEKTTLDKLNKRNIKTYRTDKDGTIKITTDGKNISIKTLDINLNG